MSKEQSPLQGLIQQYGLDNIPDDALARIGYFREAIEGGSRIRLINKPKTEHDLLWEVKIQNSPFPPAEITISEGNFTYRGIYSLEEESSLIKKLYTIRVWDNVNERTLKVLQSFTNSEPLQKLFTSFEEYLPHHPKYQNLKSENLENLLFKNWTLGSIDTYLDDVTTLGSIDNFLNNHKNDEDVIDPEQAQQMFDNLEREKSLLTDPEVEGDFLLELDNSTLTDHMKRFHPELFRYCRKMKLTNNYQIATHFFDQFLEHNNLVIPGLSQTKTPTEAIALIQQQELNQELSVEEKQLRLQLKSADHQTRIDINQRLKEIGTTKKWRRQIQEGLIQYFSFPQLYIETVSKSIKEAQALLISGSIGPNIETTLFLDPTPHKLHDANPGKVSGDCTDEKPLPFRDPLMPLYNVKVFSAESDHLGNIYLLMTQTTSNKRPVWHLDAIQIPKRTIVWDSAIPTILAPIIQAAQQKNVWGITVNFEARHISNYDFIQQATMEFHESQGLGEIEIAIPRVGNSVYSEFQGLGESRLLWKNSEYKK